MFDEITATTQDNKWDLVVSLRSSYFHFTIKPHGQISTMANTKHYAFQDDANDALVRKGYDYGYILITAAINELKQRNMPAVGQMLS